MLVFAMLSVLLAACGFQPMYGGRMAPQMAAIYVEPIADRSGYELRNSLIDLFDAGGRTQKTYRLAITLQEDQKGVALQNDATITRYNNTLEASYVLSDAKGTVLTQGAEKELSAYNVAQSPYATLVAEQDANKRAAQDIAERIRLSLGAWFRRNRP